MKPLIISCILTLPFLAGCSTTYYVPQSSDAEEFVDAQAKLNGKTATVTLVDGTEIGLESISLHADSVVGIKEDARVRQEYPLSQVKEIKTTDHDRGIGRGALKGIIVGGGLGLVAGVASLVGPKDNQDIFSPRSGGDVLVLTAACAFGGAMYGSIVGIAFLSTEHYRFSSDKVAGSDTVAESGGPEKTYSEGTNPRYVLMVERFLEETDSSVTIAWQGKTVKLPKSEITIEKRESGFQITVPVRLLQ